MFTKKAHILMDSRLESNIIISMHLKVYSTFSEPGNIAGVL